MLSQPKTPSKADADTEIEDIKKSLTAKWRIEFPARDSTWSPSRRDPKRVEDRISARIQLLFFKDKRKLYSILKQFDKNAIQIESKWQFKPHAERDVVPSSETPNSALRQEFLKKRSTLSEDAIKELTKNLEHCLRPTADQATAVEKYLKPVKPEGQKSHSCYQLRLTKTLTDELVPTNGVLLNEPNLPKPHSSLAPLRSSKSETGPANRGITPAQHPSSSEYYPDDEMVELLVDADAMDTSYAVPVQAAYTRKAGEPAKVDQSVSPEETFETPPTTPPSRKHLSPSPTERKRAHPDSMQAPPSRIVSRKTSREKSAQKVSDLVASGDSMSSLSKAIIDFPNYSLRTSTIQKQLTLILKINTIIY